ncbi:hypothetical protein MMC16_001855 [Acarospora aff. strigata]|nr:hypothetical protein [Acarospora aff. strigata]
MDRLTASNADRNTNESDSLEARFKHRLASCTDVEDIGRVIKDLNVDLQEAPGYSRVAFEHLVAKNNAQNNVFDYLENPVLNVAAAKNLRYYIRRLNLHQTLAPLCQYIRRAVALGSIPMSEIEFLVRESFPTSATGGLQCERQNSVCVTFIESIWNGLQESLVLPVEALDGHTLSLILQRLGREPYTKEQRALIGSIVASATQDQLAEMSDDISSYLVAWTRSSVLWEENRHELHSPHRGVAKLGYFIDNLHPSVANSSLASATVRIILEDRQQIEVKRIDSTVLPYAEVNDAQSVRLVQIWMKSLFRSTQFRESVVVSSEWKIVEEALLRLKHFSYLALYLTNFSEFNQCKFFIRNWRFHREDLEQGLNPQDIRQAVSHDFEVRCTAEDDTRCYSELVLALRCNEQPYAFLIHRIINIFWITSRSESTVRFLEDLQALRISVQPWILRTVVEKYSTINIRVALRIFEQHPNLHLGQCVKFAIALINDPSSHVDTTFRLLLRFRPISEKTIRQTFLTHLEANTRVLHKMATAFAHASHLTNRAAFRKVHACYIQLRRSHLVLQPEIIRAFTHVGIVRALQAREYVSERKIHWILSKIREVEGPDIERVVDWAVYRWRKSVNRAISRSQQLRRRRKSKAKMYDAASRGPHTQALWMGPYHSRVHQGHYQSKITRHIS